MRFLILLTLTLAPVATALDYVFLAGDTDRFLLVNMYDTDGAALTGLAHTDMTITYTRNNGAADVDITEASMTMGSHLGGGWAEVDSTNSPGLYQFGIPDAALANGAESVIFSFQAAGAFQRAVHATLLDVALRGSAYVSANTVQIEGGDPTDAIRGEADAALAAYDPPTNAEMEARTLPAANYFDPATDEVTTDSASREASKADVSGLATASALATAQSDLDLITGADGATLATAQPNYAPNTTAPPTVGEIRAELETGGGHLALILADTGELQTRLANMIEADGGDWRFTANALEQAPSGGGGGSGDATEANQLTILDRLAGIMDKGHTLASAVGDFDPATDSLEAIRIQGDAAWGGGGAGNTPVNHDTGGAGALKYVDGDGAGIEGAIIQAYVKSEYDAGTFTVRGQTTTKADGTWTANLMLNDGVAYTLVFYKPGAFGPNTVDVTP